MKRKYPTPKVGEIFGRYTIIKDLGTLNKRHYVECKCSCGKVRKVLGYSLSSGVSLSCGCGIKAKKGKEASNYKHGKHGSSTYKIWMGMKNRCTYPSATGYVNYGGRGIKVCESWLSYVNFLKDMGEAPLNHSIDRINNEGNYEPSNCRWALKKVQANNTRVNKRYLFKEKYLTLAEISDLENVCYDKLRWRVSRRVPNMSVEAALLCIR